MEELENQPTVTFFFNREQYSVLIEGRVNLQAVAEHFSVLTSAPQAQMKTEPRALLFEFDRKSENLNLGGWHTQCTNLFFLSQLLLGRENLVCGLVRKAAWLPVSQMWSAKRQHEIKTFRSNFSLLRNLQRRKLRVQSIMTRRQ